MPDMIIPLIIIGIVVIVALAIIGYMQEQKRLDAFRVLADKLGLQFTAAHDTRIPVRYGFLDALRQGDNRYAYNVLSGTYQQFPVFAFDFHYETHSTDSKGNRQTHHHYFSFFVLEQARDFPELRIYPETLLSRLGHMLGFEDIDFESLEFSRAFCVRSKDRKFAYDVCHARMMEYLLAHRDLSLEIEHTCVAMSFNKRLKPDEIPGRLQQLVEIVNLFPEYLYRS